MKSTLTIVFFVFVSLNLSAQLLIENFDYPTGSLLTANGWSVHSFSGTQPADVVSGLNYNGYAGGGIGGAANLDNNGEDVNRTFSSPVTTGSVYVAFIVKASSSNAAGCFVHLGQSNIGTNFFGRVWVNATGSGLGISSSTANASPPVSYIPIVPNEPNLVVLKYDVSSKVSSLYVLGSVLPTEPTTASQTFTETATINNVGSVALRQYNASQRVIVDGIRVGTTWSDAVSPCASSNLSFAMQEISKTTNDAKFSQTATSLNATTPIVYSSSVPTVATVNTTTGEVTPLSAGTTIISAQQIIGTHNEVSYCQNNATYALSILAVPTITVTEVVVPTMVAAVGSTSSETIQVSGLNLVDPNGISLNVSGDNANYFTLSNSIIAHSEGIVNTVPITITYSPMSEGLHTALLTAASVGASSIFRNLSGVASYATELKNQETKLFVTKQNGYIIFYGSEGETVELFNVQGQKLFSKKIMGGLNALPVYSDGLYIVRVGNRVAKVIL